MKKLLSVILSVTMLLTMASPVMAETFKDKSHTINYLAIGDSISSGFEGAATFSMGVNSKNRYLGYYPHDTSFSNEKNISYTNIFNSFLIDACGGQGKYSYNATGSAMRLKDFTTMLGLTEKDDYTGGDLLLKTGGLEAKYVDSIEKFNQDKSIIEKAVKEADIITINYGSNELFTFIADAISKGSISINSTTKNMQNKSIREFAHSWNLTIEYILKNNPDARIVFFGVYNPASNLAKTAYLYLFQDLFDSLYAPGVSAINNYVITGEKEVQGMEDNKYAINKTNNLLFIDTQHVADTNGMLAEDSMHPSSKGTAWMAEQLINTIKSNCGHWSYDVVGEKTATSTKKGYSGDKICNICGETIETGHETTAITSSVKTSNLPCKVKQSFKAASNLKIAKGDSVVKVKSSNSKVAKVSGLKVTGKKKGSAKITVTMKSGQKYAFTVKVQKGAVKCSKLTTKVASKVTINKGKKLSIGASKAPITCKYKITYKSSKKSVATVSKSGTITAKKKGTAKIKVSCKGKSKTITVTVK